MTPQKLLFELLSMLDVTLVSHVEGYLVEVSGVCVVVGEFQ